jgi:small subunit ribosomal protein S17
MTKHPVYKKYLKSSKKYMAHDEKNECSIGDIVRISETRPISSRKTWKLVEIIVRAK